ncbi:hypothetical protein ACFQX6_65505 [Streptosporangium lutulentum]
MIDIGSLYEPQNLDNVGGGGQGVIEALGGNVYEGLFRLTDDGTIENLLAADYKVSRDGLTYTFYLHEGCGSTRATRSPAPTSNTAWRGSSTTAPRPPARAP